MANRNYPQSRIFSNHLMPVSIDCQVAIGASGAPTIASGNGIGISSITRMAAGQYRIRLTDNFAKLLQFNATMQSPVSGAGVAAGSLTPGVVYQIATMGTTTQAQWETAGVPAGITAAVGVVFLCAATSAGTGTGKVLGGSGISAVELMGSSNNMLASVPAGGSQPMQGGYIDFQCLAEVVPVAAGTSGDAVTNNAGVLNSTGGQDLALSPITQDPANGSQMMIRILLSNSSVQ